MSRTISSSITGGVTLASGDNPVTVLSTGYISGPDGINGPAGNSWTITNEGTVAGTRYGISLAQGGTVTNAINASITGATGIYIAGPTDAASISNAGTIDGTGDGAFGVYLRALGQVSNDSTGLIEGASGIKVYGSSAVVANLGTITGTYSGSGGYGIYLRDSGTVTNGQGGFSSAMIEGYVGVDFKSSPITLPGTLANYGTIFGTGANAAAVYVDGGGTLVNGDTGALIEGGRWGAYFGLAASVTNFGTIESGGVDGDIGVSLEGGGATVSNLGPGALISGYVGVAVAYGTVINSGMIASTQPGGIAVQFMSGGDRLIVDPGAVFAGSVIAGSSGPTVLELAGASAGTLAGIGTSFTNFGTIAVDTGANWTLAGSNSVSGSEQISIGAAANLDVTGVLNGTAAFALDGGTVQFAGPLDPAASFDLSAGTADVVQLDSVPGTTVANAITGFGPADEIVLPGVTFAVGGTVTDSGGTLSAELASGGTFIFSDFASQGTPIFQLGAHTLTDTACFLSGTHILTDRGEVLVEELRAGDSVITADREPRRVRWIGHRDLDPSRHPVPDRVQPIVIRANAFADGVPHRDLRLSPDHAVLLDSVLIPARLLINSASILQETWRLAITYYHVELETHDILLAEGLPAESYLETGNRGMFDDTGLPLILHPDFGAEQRTRETGSCARFVDNPDLVEPVWRVLAGRAAKQGWALPEPPEMVNDPDLHLLVGRRVVRPIFTKDGGYVFVVAAGDAPLCLASRTARPHDACPWISDDRRLGVMIQRLRLRHGHAVREVAMDDPTLDRGWWQVEWHNERPCRWTDGEAVLPIAGPGLLEVKLAGSMPYPMFEADRRRRAA